MTGQFSPSFSPLKTVLKNWSSDFFVKEMVHFLNFLNFLIHLLSFLKKQPLELFCNKGVLRNFAKFTGKHLYQSIFFDKVAGIRPATLLKKRHWHRCFLVNFAKFLRTPSLTEHLGDCFCSSFYIVVTSGIILIVLDKKWKG